MYDYWNRKRRLFMYILIWYYTKYLYTVACESCLLIKVCYKTLNKTLKLVCLFFTITSLSYLRYLKLKDYQKLFIIKLYSKDGFLSEIGYCSSENRVFRMYLGYIYPLSYQWASLCFFNIYFTEYTATTTSLRMKRIEYSLLAFWSESVGLWP